MAVTIDAPPDQVWPWLVQMGGDRGGWYSWDRLDNGGRPSATEVHPEWQDLAFGDYVKTFRPRWLDRFVNYWLYIPVVWPMQARMLAVLKHNIERVARSRENLTQTSRT